MPELRGLNLAKAAINQIIAHPETWDQSMWHCGTTHCFFGWCQLLAGMPEDGCGITSQVAELLGITKEAAEYASDCDRTLPELYSFVQGGMQLPSDANLVPFELE